MIDTEEVRKKAFEQWRMVGERVRVQKQGEKYTSREGQGTRGAHEIPRRKGERKERASEGRRSIYQSPAHPHPAISLPARERSGVACLLVLIYR